MEAGVKSASSNFRETSLPKFQPISFLLAYPPLAVTFYTDFSKVETFNVSKYKTGI
jgi:hypothetical protein